MNGAGSPSDNPLRRIQHPTIFQLLIWRINTATDEPPQPLWKRNVAGGAGFSAGPRRFRFLFKSYTVISRTAGYQFPQSRLLRYSAWTAGRRA